MILKDKYTAFVKSKAKYETQKTIFEVQNLDLMFLCNIGD